MVSVEEVRQAARLIAGQVHRTPMLGSRTLSERLGCRLHLKAELFQRTGSFKVRGALHSILRLPPEQAARGVVSISAGNHAQAVAYAAQQAGVPATLVMFQGAVPAKVEATLAYGAEVVMEADVHRAFETVERLRDERGLSFIHPFDSADMVAGHGSLGLEIQEDLPGVHTVVVPVGGGGLIAGVAAALRGPGSAIRLVGVEPEGAPAMTRALEAGEPVRLEHLDTIADGLAPPFVGALNLEHVQRQVEQVVLVSDDEIRQALRLLLERCKLAAEPAGAASLAALLSGKVTVPRDCDAVAVVSGGNLDLSALRRMLGPADRP
jgi:threonine dehydratase